MEEKQILVLGIGNTLLCDEGFGVRAVEYLQNHFCWPENVRLVDGGTRGLLLMSELMDCDLAIILDIFLGGQKPGTICMIESGDTGTGQLHRQSAHQTGINDILTCCELAGHRPETLVFGIEPFDFQSVSASLSPEAAYLLPEFCGKVLSELEKLGIKPVPLQKIAN